MSASKKKRMGSQRRSLNQNEQKSHEEGDPANDPPVLQGRPRADAKADLTLSPESAPSEMPVRKKKLGSQRGNKGKQPFKEFSTESSHRPSEELEDATILSPDPVPDKRDILSFKSESLEKLLEGNAPSVAPESEMVGFRILDKSLNAGTEKQAIASQNSDVMGTIADGQSEKYFSGIERTREGVLSEKDQAKQMPEIPDATLPVGVTEETTCSVKLKEQEEIIITGAHDINKKSPEAEVGHNLQKPVCQESEKSSLPIATRRKLGSSRRKDERKRAELQDQRDETAAEANVFNILETTEFTKVQNSSKEVSVSAHLSDPAAGVTYKEEGQLEVHSSPKMGLDQTNKEDSLSVKTFDHTGKKEEVKVGDGKPGELQEGRPIAVEDNLFSVQIPDTGKTNAPVASPHPDVSVEIITSNQTIETIQATFIVEEQSPKTALDNNTAARVESFTQQVHDETLETVKDTIASDNFLTTGQTRYDQVEETDFVNMSQESDKSCPEHVYHESSQESEETVDRDITPDKSLTKNISDITTSTAEVKEPVEKSNTSPNEKSVNFNYAYLASDAVHKERSEKDLKEDDLLDSSHETFELEGQVEKSSVTEVIHSKEETVTVLSEPMFSVLPEIQPSGEEQLNLVECEDYIFVNFTTAPPSGGAIDKNDVVVAQTEDVYKITSSSQDARSNSSAESTEQEKTSDQPRQCADSISTTGDGNKGKDQKQEVQLSDHQPEDLEKEKLFEPGAALSSEQIQHRDNTKAPLVSPDVTATGSQLFGNRRKLGSSRRTKERRQVADESMQDEISEEINKNIGEKQTRPALVEQSIETEFEKQAAGHEEVAESFVQSHNETMEKVDITITTGADRDISHNKAAGQEESSIQPIQGVSAESDEGKINISLKTTEITALFKEVVQEQKADGDTNDKDFTSKPDGAKVETPTEDTTTRHESSTEARDLIEQSYLSIKEPINVHQLTYLSDNDSHEEMENWALRQTEQPGHKETREPPKTVQLLHKEGDETDPSPHRGPSRRKLGSSRRTKEKKITEVTTSDNEGIFSIEEKDAGKVTERMSSAEEMPQQELHSNDSEQEHNVKPEDIEGCKAQENYTDIKIQVVSPEDKPLMEVIQKEGFTIKDLKETIIAAAEDSPRDADNGTDRTRSQNESTAESEEIVKEELSDASQIVVMSTEDAAAKDQQVVKDMDVLEAGAELQINPKQERRKMGSTRRSQLNRKRDEERHTKDNAEIFEEMTRDDEIQVSFTEDTETKPLSSDIFVKQEATIAAGPVTEEQQGEENKDGQEVEQEGRKEEVLQTEDAALVVELDVGRAMQNVHPDTGEEIHPPSPGKRRKMGSTRKSLRSNTESPRSNQEELSKAVNVENEATVSVSNENVERKEDAGLLVHTATVHQQPDEETPLRQQNNQEEFSSESLANEAEMASKPDVTDEAAVTKRRKMGSHRRPHTDQSIRQGTLPDSQSAKYERVLQPLAEESPKVGQISQVDVRETRASSTPSLLGIKAAPKPVSQRPSQHQPLPPTNVRLSQERPRLSSGVGNKASLNVSKYDVVMIGDSSVGKTSFIKRAHSGKFSSDVPASVGMDSYMWNVLVDGKTVALHLWDTAGQERFRSMTKQIFHRAQAFLLMYDVSCSQSFTAVSYWANSIKEGALGNVVILLIGNKSDCTNRRVQRHEGELLAQENNFAFMECSAATGENVIEALETVARLLSQTASREEEPLVLRKPEQKNKLGCC